MGNYRTLWITSLLIGFMGCGQTSTDKSLKSTIDDVEPNNPGPVTPLDRERYNLGTNDELLHGRIDTTNEVSLPKDTL